MDECTGMLRRRTKIMRPKTSPRALTTRPPNRSVCPLMPPRKVAEPRSGSFRLASPPALLRHHRGAQGEEDEYCENEPRAGATPCTRPARRLKIESID